MGVSALLQVYCHGGLEALQDDFGPVLLEYKEYFPGQEEQDRMGTPGTLNLLNFTQDLSGKKADGTCVVCNVEGRRFGLPGAALGWVGLKRWHMCGMHGR